MLQLPSEILFNIFLYLDFDDIVNLSTVCRSINNILEDEYYWSIKYKTDFRPVTRYGSSWKFKYHILVSAAHEIRRYFYNLLKRELSTFTWNRLAEEIKDFYRYPYKIDANKINTEKDLTRMLIRGGEQWILQILYDPSFHF